MNKESLGKRIAEERLKSALSQSTLSQMVGITQEHLSRIENGKYMPRVDMVKKMADVFGCMVDDLI